MIIEIKNKNIIHIFPSESIIYCKAEGNYTSYVLEDKKVLSYQTLKNTYDNLPSCDFCRCHNSFIVNLSKIRVFDTHKNILILKDKLFVPVSNRRKKVLQHALKLFIRYNS